MNKKINKIVYLYCKPDNCIVKVSRNQQYQQQNQNQIEYRTVAETALELYLPLIWKKRELKHFSSTSSCHTSESVFSLLFRIRLAYYSLGNIWFDNMQ